MHGGTQPITCEVTRERVQRNPYSDTAGGLIEWVGGWVLGGTQGFLL